MDIMQQMGKTYITTEYDVAVDREYLVSMITENRIEGLVSCKIGYEQSKKMIYYDVTNMESLEHKYSEAKLSLSDIYALFNGLTGIVKGIGEYLLDEKYLLYNPRYIFSDIENSQLYQIYVPNKGEDETNPYSEMADFLLKTVNPKDDKAVRIAYLFYRMISLETFSLAEFVKIVEKETTIEEIYQKPENKDRFVNEEDISNNISTAYEEEINYVPIWLPIIVSFGTAGLVMVYIIWQKQLAYSIYILIAAVIMLIVAIILWVKFICGLSERSRDEDMADANNNMSVDQYWGYDERTVVYSDETQVFGYTENNRAESLGRDYSLVWKENGVSKKYRIMSYPVVIGKMKNEVDCYIDDSTVSRIHARIEREDDEVVLIDMNSTNGTSVNGQQLLPCQKVVIDSESDIRIGNVYLRIQK